MNEIKVHAVNIDQPWTLAEFQVLPPSSGGPSNEQLPVTELRLI